MTSLAFANKHHAMPQAGRYLGVSHVASSRMAVLLANSAFWVLMIAGVAMLAR